MPNYQSHENFWSDLRIYFRMFKRAILIGLIIQIFIFGGIVYNSWGFLENIHTKENLKLPLKVALKYYSIDLIGQHSLNIEQELAPYAQGWPELVPEWYNFVADHATGGAYDQYGQYISKWLKFSFSSYIFSLVYLFIFIRKSKKSSEEKFIRGSQLIPPQIFQKLVNHSAHSLSIEIGEIKIPFEAEPKHILVLGAAGSGKGVLLNQMIAQINLRKHNDRIIFYDIKGEFISKHFKEGDIVFNPFDGRSIGWSLCNEIEIYPDYDILSDALFPCLNEENQLFYSGAASIFKTGLIYLAQNNTTTNADIWDFFSKSVPAIEQAFKTLPTSQQGALKFLENHEGSGPSSSMVAILQDRIKFMEYLVGMDGDFSFRKFIREGQGNLHIVNSDRNFAKIFKPIMTFAIDIMVKETLSLRDDLNRRIFFLIDEMGTLDRMDSILDLLTVGRSKGAALICANQDLGRIEGKYGKENLKTFFNNFNTNFIFCVRDPESTKFLSAAIGEQQLLKTTESLQLSKDGKSVSEQERTEALVMPSELSNLPTLHAYISISGYGVSKIIVPSVYYPAKYPHSVMRVFSPVITGLPPVVEQAIAEPKTNESEQEKNPIISGNKIKKFEI